MINRRQFIGTLGAGSLAALTPLKTWAANPRVVVVGGGMAGAAVAKYLRLWSNKTIDVTLVTPDTTYVSNIMSNLVVTGQVAYSSLQFTYANLTSKYGVKVVKGTVTGIDGFGANATGTVSGNGFALTCERVVLAPGIKMDDVLITGTSTPAPVLHAWQAGQQTLDLQNRLKNMSGNQTFVMTIPKAPYRCPPGPYERACVVADYLKRNKPGSKIIVLDANPDITAEPENFHKAFQTYFDLGVLEYWPATSVESVAGATAGSNQTLTVNAPFGTARPLKRSGGEGIQTLFGNVVNIIPPHRAPTIVSGVGLVDAGGFAPVDVRSFESTISGKGKIYVIGDAANTSLPKAGHVGNQEAKICASAIINAFKSLAYDPAPTANSACFSPINSTQASWLTAVYQYKETDKTGASLPPHKRMVIWDGVANAYAAGPTEASAPSTGNFSKMNTWYKVLMAETFA